MASMTFYLKQTTQFRDGVTPWVVAFKVKDFEDKMHSYVVSAMNRAALKDEPEDGIKTLRRWAANGGLELDEIRIMGSG